MRSLVKRLTLLACSAWRSRHAKQLWPAGEGGAREGATTKLEADSSLVAIYREALGVDPFVLLQKQ
ncbi:hypothetical protein BBI10_10175 [Pseudomonas graminis]|uniref:Uncharacterized protein n=1 Tax=Pseudomonas graminis TaxID=158627 RepID=A0A1C2E4I2_9PSED|nr:hypothetical protein BBI10_10175 [Pseudomonas graminis]